MADSENRGRLKDAQITRLAASIAGGDLEVIALEFLGLDVPTIKNMKYDRVGDIEASSRDILEHWRNGHPGPNQCQVKIKMLSNNGKINIRHVDSVR